MRETTYATGFASRHQRGFKPISQINPPAGLTSCQIAVPYLGAVGSVSCLSAEMKTSHETISTVGDTARKSDHEGDPYSITDEALLEPFDS